MAMSELERSYLLKEIAGRAGDKEAESRQHLAAALVLVVDVLAASSGSSSKKAETVAADDVVTAIAEGLDLLPDRGHAR
jgi:hypothetical protein